ncbi:MAG: hypothetical protein C5B50_27585 [Verrucomicrobia bacterium]|nr:MAG: hypothetical protein C5B50_27585 [Verrucomicrobiota bacterium]
MRKLGFWAILLMLALASARAQIAVELDQDQDQFLPGESLRVAVKITNRSGQVLKLGGDADWLKFWIESSDGLVMPKTGEPPVTGEFSLESSEMATKRVDLMPYFNMPHSGRYAIVATVRIKAWDREITSAPRTFFIIDGAKLWEQEFGVPNSGTTNTAPEMRRYILQQANYLKGTLRLYARVADAEGKAIKVFSLGPTVSFSRPQPLVDKSSNLHVLYQNGARTYSYTELNPDGDVIARQFFEYVTSRPRLREDDQGTISVLGGVRRPSTEDIPSLKAAETPAVSPSSPKSSGKP